MTDLRTRIAAVLARFLCEDECGMDFDNGLACPTCVRRSLPEADAVIRELGLERQAHYDPGCNHHRYVTDWTTDEIQ